MKSNAPHILLVNPWIHDFAAYDFWAKPMGLLYLAAILRAHGYDVSYIDCLDRFHPKSPRSDPHARCGRGPYLKQPIKKPDSLSQIPRKYSRYGIKPEWFHEDLLKLKKPDLVLVTSQMTYWYPGVMETIRCIRRVLKDTPVILGGVYATLCLKHAEMNSGADHVAPGVGEGTILELVSSFTGISSEAGFDPGDIDTYPFPAYDLQNRINYVPLLTSRGCPFSCAYCASRRLSPKRMTRDPDSIIGEIRYWQSAHGVMDFVFYDDALLANPESHAIPLLEQIVKTKLKLRFHTPNAIHVRGVTRETAGLMKTAGFHTIRLGLETASFKDRKRLDTKVTAREFMQAAQELKRAGFDEQHVGAYLLVGLPGQTLDEVTESIEIVKQNHITPIPAYYSPIPHTALWEEAVATSNHDLNSDPIFTNNAIFPCMKKGFSWEVLTRLKKTAAD